jgi:hypothetical protein
MPSRLITISVRTADVIRMYGGESFQNLKPNGDGFLIEIEDDLFKWCCLRTKVGDTVDDVLYRLLTCQEDC